MNRIPAHVADCYLTSRYCMERAIERWNTELDDLGRAKRRSVYSKLEKDSRILALERVERNIGESVFDTGLVPFEAPEQDLG